jgi:hypothetical protein
LLRKNPLSWLCLPHVTTFRRKKTSPHKKNNARAARSPPSSALPSSAAELPESAVSVVHAATLHPLSAAPPSSVPPHRRRVHDAPVVGRGAPGVRGARRPHRHAAPVVRAATGCSSTPCPQPASSPDRRHQLWYDLSDLISLPHLPTVAMMMSCES